MSKTEMYRILNKINQLRHEWISLNYAIAGDNNGDFDPSITGCVKDLARLMEEIESEYKEEK